MTQTTKLNDPHLIIPAEDFWSRQHNAQTKKFEFAPFGMSTKITANQTEVLEAAKISAGRFSQASKQNYGKPAQIQIVVKAEPCRAVPANLPEQLTYSGVGDWITLSAGEWGHAFAHLGTREATVIVSASLAVERQLVSRYFIDHYLLNFLLTDWAMLHASCLLSADRQRLIIMIAPHNTGKSTTALHLLQVGYIFLADGMALLRYDEADFIVGGYPVGEVKLRDDVLSAFKHVEGKSVRVREYNKTVVNLRQTHPGQLAQTLVRPASIDLCFVERVATPRTHVSKLPAVEAVSRFSANTLFWDETERLVFNSNTLHYLLDVANLYQVQIGTDVSGIIATLNELT